MGESETTKPQHGAKTNKICLDIVVITFVHNGQEQVLLAVDRSIFVHFSALPNSDAISLSTDLRLNQVRALVDDMLPPARAASKKTSLPESLTLESLAEKAGQQNKCRA
ncbi:hypothetical protein ACLKA6_008992 [Drosophila palustris]